MLRAASAGSSDQLAQLSAAVKLRDRVRSMFFG